MVSSFWILTGLCLSAVVADAANSRCEDVDTQACQLIFAKQPNMCNDTLLSETTCVRFCNKCPLECYHCDAAVTNQMDCNTTRAYDTGQACMLRTLQSTADGHHEYLMTCEAKKTCDGEGLSLPFGKREVKARNLHVTCCTTDLCNYPSRRNTSPPLPPATSRPATAIPSTNMTKQTTLSTPQTTTSSLPTTPACLKDVIFVVDEYYHFYYQYPQTVMNFIASVVADLNVSQQGTHVSLGSFSSTYHTWFDLNRHDNVADLQAAIRSVHFSRSYTNLKAGFDYLFNHALTSASGNRPNVTDAVVIITSNNAPRALGSLYENELHKKSDDVIVIGYGLSVTSHDLQEIATDNYHMIKELTAYNFQKHQKQVVNLICA